MHSNQSTSSITLPSTGNLLLIEKEDPIMPKLTSPITSTRAAPRRNWNIGEKARCNSLGKSKQQEHVASDCDYSTVQ